MSWKAEHHKIYETPVVNDALDRLAKWFDMTALPLSGGGLQTLAKHERESFRAFGSSFTRVREKAQKHFAEQTILSS